MSNRIHAILKKGAYQARIIGELKCTLVLEYMLHPVQNTKPTTIPDKSPINTNLLVLGMKQNHTGKHLKSDHALPLNQFNLPYKCRNPAPHRRV